MPNKKQVYVFSLRDTETGREYQRMQIEASSREEAEAFADDSMARQRMSFVHREFLYVMDEPETFGAL